MGLEAKLVQKMGQSLLMTPQLQQAIKLLQLGRMEYKEALERELLENPILEESPNSEEPGRLLAVDPAATSTDAPEQQMMSDDKNEIPLKDEKPEWEEYLENLFSEPKSVTSNKGSTDYEDRPSFEASLTRTETLHEFITSQVRLLSLPKEQEQVLLHVIGNIDKDGYLDSTYEEIAAAVPCTVEEVGDAAAVLKQLEPQGLGARNLQECLLIQLEDIGMGESLAASIVQHHLDKIESRKLQHIVKAENTNLDKIQKAIEIIRELEPKPGRQFADETIRYAIPDIFVYKVGHEYVVSLNEDGLPKLRVNSYYLDLLRKDDGGEPGGNKAYVNERLKAATFLIKSIHQRQQTIMRVTQSIVKYQREFFDSGIDKMKPLTLRDVADDIGMHESTVSRVTTNKFVHTPQGVFELKYFFTTGIKTLEGDVSSSTIKEKIKRIIEGESDGEPVSDQQIVEMLKADNVIIARRTVAKYREGLNILSSSRRKKLF